MTAIKTLTVLAAGAFALSAAGTVQAQTPYSAYSNQTNLPASCRNVQQLQNGYVSAECQTSGGWRWSALRPVDCRSSITNRDGVLTCTGARATVGDLYPANSGYNGQAQTQAAPGGVIGALLGAVFGDTFGDNRRVEDDYNQGRRPLYERRADLDARIDAGVRDGSLSRTEATRLRSDYNGLVELEARYAADGRLTTQESDDLRNRYQALSQRVGEDRRDGDGYDSGYGYGDDDGYGWRPLAGQRTAFDARVDVALRDRRLSRTEALRLRSDFDALVRLEAGYRRDGLSSREQQDLTARLADLDRRIGDVAYDGGYGVDPRAAQIEARIMAGERSGQFSRSEAARLREELRDLTRRWAELEARVQIRR